MPSKSGPGLISPSNNLQINIYIYIIYHECFCISSSESHYNRLELESATVELNELFVQDVSKSFSHDPGGMSKRHSGMPDKTK
jgi:hypothetical protein